MCDSAYYTFWKGCSFQICNPIRYFGSGKNRSESHLTNFVSYRIGYSKFSDRIIEYPKTKKIEIFKGKVHKTSFGLDRIIRYFGYLILKTDISDLISENFPCFRYFWIFENEKSRSVSDPKIFGYPFRNIRKLKK